MKTVTITLTTAGANTGPTFNLSSDSNGYDPPFETGVAKSLLISGYTTSAVPDDDTMILVTSIGTCTGSTLITISDMPTPTPTPTPTPGYDCVISGSVLYIPPLVL